MLRVIKREISLIHTMSDALSVYEAKKRKPITDNAPHIVAYATHWNTSKCVGTRKNVIANVRAYLSADDKKFTHSRNQLVRSRFISIFFLFFYLWTQFLRISTFIVGEE